MNPNWILKKLNCTFSSFLKLHFLFLGSFLPLSVSVSGGSGESTQPFVAPMPLPVSAGCSGESVYPSPASTLLPAAPPPPASMPPPTQPPARPPEAAVLSPGPAPSPPEVSASAHPAWPLDLLCLGRRRFPGCRPLNYVACGSPLECIVSARSLSTNLLNSVWF